MRAIVATLVLSILLGASWPASAAVPEMISYQGVLKESDGSVVSDGVYTIDFRIYNVASGGEFLWSETQDVDVTDGLFSVILGNVVAIDLAFDEAYWLGVSIGGDAELAPRAPLAAAPYACRAAVAESLDGGGGGGDDGDWVISGTDLYSAVEGNVGIGTQTPASKLDVQGQMRATRYLDADNTSYYLDPAHDDIAAKLKGRVGIRGAPYTYPFGGGGPDLHVNTVGETAYVWIGGNLNYGGATIGHLSFAGSTGFGRSAFAGIGGLINSASGLGSGSLVFYTSWNVLPGGGYAEKMRRPA